MSKKLSFCITTIYTNLFLISAIFAINFLIDLANPSYFANQTHYFGVKLDNNSFIREGPVDSCNNISDCNSRFCTNFKNNNYWGIIIASKTCPINPIKIADYYWYIFILGLLFLYFLISCIDGCCCIQDKNISKIIIPIAYLTIHLIQIQMLALQIRLWISINNFDIIVILIPFAIFQVVTWLDFTFFRNQGKDSELSGLVEK